MRRYRSYHMIKSENLNHHGNLYAGQGIEWMVETSFIAIGCEYDDPQGILYKNTQKFDFYHSVYPGDIVYYEGTIVRAGRASVTMRVGLYDAKTGTLNAEGFTTFVIVNPETNKPVPHGIVLDEPADEEEKKWREEADAFSVRK